MLVRVNGQSTAYPAVYHAPSRDEAEEGLRLFHVRLADTAYQAAEPTKPNLYAARQIQRVKPWAVLS